MKDKDVQTDLELLDNWFGDYFLDNITTEESTRLTQDFIDRYKNNPDYAEYFRTDDIREWSTNIENISPSSATSTDTHINFLLRIREM